MAIRITFNGATVEADTKEEVRFVFELISEMTGRRAPKPKPVVKVKTPDNEEELTPDEWNILMRLLEDKPAQKKALHIIKRHGTIDAHTLMEELGAESPRILSGVLSGLKKNMNKAGLSSDEVFVRVKGWDESQLKITYTAGPLLELLEDLLSNKFIGYPL